MPTESLKDRFSRGTWLSPPLMRFAALLMIAGTILSLGFLFINSHGLLDYAGRPLGTDFSSFCDPTHRWHLNSYSLRYFGDNNAGYGYYSTARFREVKVHVRLLALWRYLGFEILVNKVERFRRFWEHYLCFVIRGKVIDWELEKV